MERERERELTVCSTDSSGDVDSSHGLDFIKVID